MKKNLLGIFILFLILDAAGQPASDSVFFRPFSGKEMITAAAISDESGLYNGKEHLGYLYTIEGFAYYLSKDFQPGSVIYDGVLYHNVPIMYDMVKDEVIVRHTRGFFFSLISEKVKAFSIGDHSFLRIQGDEHNELNTGFYEVMHDRGIVLLAHRGKIIVENIVVPNIERKFVESYQFYAVKDGVFHKIRNERTVLNLLQARKAELRQHLKKSGIKFRKNPELALLTLAQKL